MWFIPREVVWKDENKAHDGTESQYSNECQFRFFHFEPKYIRSLFDLLLPCFWDFERITVTFIQRLMTPQHPSCLLQETFYGANLIMCWLSWQQRANMHCMHVNYEIHIFATCIREYCDWWGLEFGESWWCIWIFLNWRITASTSTSCISCLFWSRSSNRCRGAGSALERSLFDCISFFSHPAIL